MRKATVTILSMTLVLAGTAAIVNAAGGGEREVAASSAAVEADKIPNRRAQAQAAVRCRTLRCLNRKLTRLFRETYKCERYVELTSYAGYLYSPTGSTVTTTSALDYTESGDSPSDRFVVYVC